MRTPLLIALVVALGGCSTIRQGLGEYQKAADKGVEVKVGDAASVSGDTAKSAALPGGLGGDKANAAYTTPPQ